MPKKSLLLSLSVLVLVFSGPPSFAEEVHVTFRGIVDLLDDRSVTHDARSLIVIPNLAVPAKLPLVEECRPKSKHYAYILYDPNRVNLEVDGTGTCFREIKENLRSCADGKTYSGYSLAGCAARFAKAGADGVKTVRWAVGEVPVRPTDEANLNWLFDIDALTFPEKLPLRRGLSDSSPDYQNYPILASRIVLDRGELHAGYVYRAGGGPVRFPMRAPHPDRAGSSGMEWSVGEDVGKLSLCPLDDPDCAPVDLQFSSRSPGTGIHVLVVSEQFGTEKDCDHLDHTVSHFYAHYALRFGSETLEKCGGPEYSGTPLPGLLRVQSNPQCSPADNQWP